MSGDGAKMDKERADREEFDLAEERVTKLELWSWYAYDWANSVYSSVVIGMFLPLVLLGLSDAYGCPNTYEPKYGDDGAVFWNGFANDTTSCVLSSRADQRDSYGGGGDPGRTQNYWPLYMQTYYDSSLDPFWVQDYVYSSSDDLLDKGLMNCSYVGVLEFLPIRNLTSVPTQCAEKHCHDLEPKGTHKPPIRTFEMYEVTMLDPPPGPWSFDMTSSNDFLIPDGIGSQFSVSHSAVEIVGGKSQQKFQLHIEQNMWAVGASTLNITFISGEGTSQLKRGNAAFTLVSIFYYNCPYSVRFMFMNIRPMTYTSFVLGISVLGQALVFFTVAAFGDFGPFRKLLLCYFSFFGSMSVVCFIFCNTPDMYLVAGVLTVISNVFFGASQVLYCAFLPYLSRSHPTFLDAKFEYKNIKTGAATGVGAASKKLLDTYHNVQDDISATGYFWGYISGSFCCFICIAIVLMLNSLFGLLLAITAMGFWWTIFALPAFFFLKSRPGPPFPEDIKNFSGFMTFSWRRILAGMMALQHLPNTRRFLIAYFFFSDGYNTIVTVAILFAKTELGMDMTGLITLGAMTPLCGALGMKVFRAWQVKRNASGKTMLLKGLYILLLIPIYGCIGFLREFDVWPSCPIGLVQRTEMYVIVIVFGMTLGPTQSYARTFFTDLIPPGQESEYFGVFEISDRGSSWIGPIICGTMFELTGSLRLAMFYLLFAITTGLYLTYTTDAVRGSDDCRRKEVLVRMQAVRLKWGIAKSQAPPSAKKMVGLKSSNVSGKSGASAMSSTSSTSSMSSVSSSSGVERSSVDAEEDEVDEKPTGLKAFNANNKVAPAAFEGKPVLEEKAPVVDDTAFEEKAVRAGAEEEDE